MQSVTRRSANLDLESLTSVVVGYRIRCKVEVVVKTRFFARFSLGVLIYNLFVILWGRMCALLDLGRLWGTLDIV